MKFRYLFALPYDEIHTRFYRRHFPGETVSVPDAVLDDAAVERINALNGPECVWFYTRRRAPLLELLRGRRVHISHGSGFIARGHSISAALTARYADALFIPNRQHFRRHLEEGIPREKLKEVGEPLFLEIPGLPVEQNTLLISLTAFTPWHPFETTLEILRALDTAYKTRVSFHPLLEEEKKEALRAVCRSKPGLNLIETDNELLEAFAVCRLGMGQYGSLAAPFWQRGKPWVFIRGKMTGLRPLRGWNPLKGFGWARTRNQLGDPDFDRILTESAKVSKAEQVTRRLLEEAPASPSAKSLFFEWNHDEAEMVRRIRAHLEALF